MKRAAIFIAKAIALAFAILIVLTLMAATLSLHGGPK